MNLYKKTAIVLLMTLPFLFGAVYPCCTITFSGGTYTFSAPVACARAWRVNQPSEDYTFCWVFSDGSYVRTPGYYGSVNNNGPNTSIPSGQYPTGTKLMHTMVTNRYGDDTDKKRVIGGPVPLNSISIPQLFNAFPLGQSIMAAPALTMIQTDHTNDEVAKNQELMLILTVNSDHIENNDSLEFMLTENNYILRLYHKNSTITYDTIRGETTTYPVDSGEYFAFAPLHNSTYTYLNNTYLPVSSWVIQNNTFQGHEKNIYCLLKVPNIEGVNDENRELDTFVAVLTKISSAAGTTPVTYALVSGSESKLPIAIGKSHDPNVIEVNIPTSTQCGPDANGVQEELEYTVHFQNIGSTAAQTVEVNLDLDPNLDPGTLAITEIGIGTAPFVATTAATISQQQANYAAIGKFEYTLGTSNSAFITSLTYAQVSSVTADVKFLFSGIQLEGINAVNTQLSKGYIKFKIKTAGPYQTINNQAGIFFDDNPEIVTNLAETKCLSDATAMNCDSCRMHLKECRDQFKNARTNSSDSWMHWLGWIIAGLELLIIIYLLTRKREK